MERESALNKQLRPPSLRVSSCVNPQDLLTSWFAFRAFDYPVSEISVLELLKEKQ